ncbi:hypothetical protein ES702_03214 [subsurface metagenome]
MSGGVSGIDKDKKVRQRPWRGTRLISVTLKQATIAAYCHRAGNK